MPLRPNASRARYAILMIQIILVMEVVSFTSSYMQYQLIESVNNGAELSMDEADANDRREQLIGIVHFIAIIISAVTFIQWFRRAYFNLSLRVKRLSQTEGWAAGAWFVPIVNLFRPYQMMKEMYEETLRYLRNAGENVRYEVPYNLLGTWWALWVLSGVIGQISFRISMDAETLEELSRVTLFGMAEYLIGIPLAILAIKVVKDYSNLEPMLQSAVIPPSDDSDSMELE